VAEPRRRSTFGRTVLLGLAAAAVATVAATQTWAEATRRTPGVRTVSASGSDVAPAVLPLALVALACWGTVLVLRRTGRRVVSVLGALAALVAAVVAGVSAGDAGTAAGRVLGSAPDSTSTTGWPWVAVAACLVCAATFCVAVARAGSWPEMSSRYDAQGDDGRATDPGDDPTGADPSGAALWKAIDEGKDPTV
jgi:uncharacterized membrane protein (TIGR02234 family)